MTPDQILTFKIRKSKAIASVSKFSNSKMINIIKEIIETAIYPTKITYASQKIARELLYSGCFNWITLKMDQSLIRPRIM